MKRRVLALALVVLLVFVAGSASAGPGKKKGPQKSSFYDLVANASSEFGFGLGNIADLMCVVSSATQPAVYAGNSLVDCDGEVPHNESSMAVDPTNPNHAVTGYHSFQIVGTGAFAHVTIQGLPSVTFNGGTSWTEVAPRLAPYEFSGDPVVGFNSSGRLYLANIADHEGENGFPFTGPSVIVQISEDGGLTWTKPITVAKGQGVVDPNSGGKLVFQDKEWLTVDTSSTSPFQGRVYTTWSSFQEFFNGANPFVRVPIMFSRSSNGTAWSSGKDISGFSTACVATISGAPNECDLNQFSVPTVAPGGKLYVAFENFNTPAENQYMVVRSTNGGSTFSNPVRVDTIFDINYPENIDGRGTLTGCQLRINSGGGIAADLTDSSGNTVVLAWSDNRNGTSSATNVDIRLARSTDGGQTWRLFTIDSSPNDQFYPWVAVAPNGRVDVGYMDRSYSASQSECKYGFSLTRLTFDGAGNIATSVKTRVDTGLSDAGQSRWFSGLTGGPTTFVGDYNGVAVGSNGKTWSTWTDMRATVADPPSPTRNHGQHIVVGTTP